MESEKLGSSLAVSPDISKQVTLPGFFLTLGLMFSCILKGEWAVPRLLFPSSQVNVSVHNRLELRNSSNVLGIIRGAVEPGERLLTAPAPPGPPPNPGHR